MLHGVRCDRGFTCEIPGCLLQRSVSTETSTTASMEVPGKVGEFVEDHRGWLVPVVFPWATKVAVSIAPGKGSIQICPTSFSKMRRVCELLLRSFQREEGVDVKATVLRCPPVGRGLATSTTTMFATCRALAAVLGVQTGPQEIARLLAHIEPTDACTAQEGMLVMWDFLKGLPLSEEYRLPEGGYIGIVPLHRSLITDTIKRPVYRRTELSRLEALFHEVPNALRAGDAPWLADASSRSIEINDTYFPKPELPILRQLRQSGAALGYFGAHSGTASGLITRPERFQEVFDEVVRRMLSAWKEGYRVVGFRYTAEDQKRPFRFLHDRLVTAIVPAPGEELSARSGQAWSNLSVDM
jgi:uncharacterized protein involved in propanediol utilization